MTDEQKRIEELEQQLKIAKLEKELAEIKGENTEAQNKVKQQEEQNTYTKEEIIENYINEKFLKTDCILVGEKLTNEIIIQSGMQITDDEKPLLLLYKKNLFYDLKTRILITNKHIYFKSLPDTFWIGLTCNFAKKIEGKFDLQKIRNIEIGELDHALGSAYIGHQLKINNDVIGLVRMGADTEYDEEAIRYLNSLFKEISVNDTISNTKSEDSSNDQKEKSSNKEGYDSWQAILLKFGFIIIVATVFLYLFPHAFDAKIVIQNGFTGEKIEIPVQTKKVDGKNEYCITISILEGEEHTFCSMDKDSLTNFITTVKEQEMKMIAKMEVRGEHVNKDVTKHFSLDKIIYETPKQRYNIYEPNSEDIKEETEKDTIIVKKAVETYHKEQNKEMANEMGISPDCYKKYSEAFKQVYDWQDALVCSNKENQVIKDYIKRDEVEGYNNEYALDDISEPLWTNNTMPKSLVLKDVPIMCFEKANLGDNSKCTEKQLNIIKEFYKNKQELDWEKEYFEY